MKKYLLLLIALFIPLPALAAIDISPTPIFNITNWAPGESQTQEVTVTSHEAKDQTLALKVKGTKTAFSDYVILKVVQKPDNVKLFEHSLSTLYESEELGLGIIKAGETRKFEFTAAFSPDAGNDLQGKTQTFDLSFGFVAEDVPENPVTPENPTTPPANIVDNIVNNFRTALTTVTPTVNQEPTAAGRETNDQPEVKGSNETNGSETKDCPWWWIVGLILAAVLAIYYLVVRWADPEKKLLYSVVSALPVVFAVLAWGAHYYLHDAGDYFGTVYCDYFWLIVLIETLIAYGVYYLLAVRESQKTQNA